MDTIRYQGGNERDCAYDSDDDLSLDPMIFELPGDKENTHTMLELHDLHDESNAYVQYIQPIQLPTERVHINLAEIQVNIEERHANVQWVCLLYTSPSPRDS